MVVLGGKVANMKVNAQIAYRHGPRAPFAQRQ
jgi:hypothetical protein